MAVIAFVPAHLDTPSEVRVDWPVTTISPRRIEIMEPLTTKVPNPNLARPYCCYLNTVIFYARPLLVRQWHHLYLWRGSWAAEKPGTHLEEWGRVETKLSGDTRVDVDGRIFTCGGGRVEWHRKRWWMRHFAELAEIQ